MTIRNRKTPAALVAAMAVAFLATPALAGKLEINQVCATSAQGCFPGDDPGFPVEIREVGSYVLTSDLAVSTLGVDAIQLDADGPINLDLRGFTVEGPATCTGVGETLDCTAGTGYGIVDEGPNDPMVNLENGRVMRFAEGGVRLGRMSRAKHVTTIENGSIGFRTSVMGVVSHITAERNDSTGISLYYSVVSDCVSRDNRWSGLFTYVGVVQRVAITGSGHAGAEIGSTLARDLSVSDSVDDGIRGKLLLDSTIVGSGSDGFRGSGWRSLMAGTVVRGSGGYGVSSASSSNDVSFLDSNLTQNALGDLSGPYWHIEHLGGSACSGAPCP